MSMATRSGHIDVDGKSYLLGGVVESAYPPANVRAVGSEAPAFDGDVAAFVAAGNADDQLYNRIKKCSDCGKVCAVSMADCNGCGKSLSEVAPTSSNNVFMGFIHGIAKGPFPFKISMRLETPNLLVFDDPLALARCHVCACPTDIYVPDLRSLFMAPSRGLALLQALDDACWEATEARFLSDEPWAKATFSPAGLALPRPTLRKEHVLSGLNYPPSQFQLHLQYLLPPLTPYHWGLHRSGKHFSAGRFFPLQYVYKALTALRDDGQGGVPSCLGMDASELCAAVLARTGVDYEVEHRAMFEAVTSSHEFLANYSTKKFKWGLPEDDSSAPPVRLQTLLPKDQTAPSTDATSGGEVPSRKSVEDGDRLALQSYGRPYDENGKPSGVYYSHPKPSPVPTLAFESPR